MPELSVYVVGDSLMWGQGLQHRDKFAVLAVREIAAARGQEVVLEAGSERFAPRSGAKLLAKEKKVPKNKIDVPLPSGATKEVFKGDRADFYDRFPVFFTTDSQVDAFFTGEDQSPAKGLFGDIPATFPTITAQVRAIPDDIGRGIDVLLINGSANDVDFEEVLDPLDGLSTQEIDRTITEFGFQRLKSVLGEARRKCPNAVMLVPGYFPPFSGGSNRGELKDLAKYMADNGPFALAMNDFLTSWYGKLTALGVLGDIVGLTEDVGAAVDRSIHRSEYAFARGLFSMRRAVTELFESDLRGPGIVFVHAGFGPENSAFGSAPFLHEGYRAPSNDDHPVQDAALQARLEAPFARIGFIGRLGGAIEDIHRFLLITGPGLQHRDLADSEVAPLRGLRNDLEGPTSLRRALTAMIEDFGPSTAAQATGALETEQGRLQTARIASFLHPNEAGARRYADAISRRYARHRKGEVKADLRRLTTRPGQPSPATLSVKQALRRYGLDPTIGMRACLQHMVVDSLAVETVAARAHEVAGPGIPRLRILLTVKVGPDHQWTVTNLLQPFAKAGAKDLFAIDTRGELHLGDIHRLELQIGSSPPLPLKVELTSITLFVNGKAVFMARPSAALKAGDWLVLPYPHP